MPFLIPPPRRASISLSPKLSTSTLPLLFAVDGPASLSAASSGSAPSRIGLGHNALATSLTISSTSCFEHGLSVLTSNSRGGSSTSDGVARPAEGGVTWTDGYQSVITFDREMTVWVWKDGRDTRAAEEGTMVSSSSPPSSLGSTRAAHATIPLGPRHRDQLNVPRLKIAFCLSEIGS